MFRIVSVSFRFVSQISVSQVTLVQVLISDSRFLIPDSNFGFRIPDFRQIRFAGGHYDWECCCLNSFAVSMAYFMAG